MSGFTTFEQEHIKRGTKKLDIMDLPLDEIKKMTAEEILQKFRMVIYSKEDVAEINRGLKIIRNVLNKNTKKLKG